MVVFANRQIGAPLFDSVISSDHDVDINDSFAGTGVAPFNLTVSLAQGDTLQFAVFSGPSLSDGTFDSTALRFQRHRRRRRPAECRANNGQFQLPDNANGGRKACDRAEHRGTRVCTCRFCRSSSSALPSDWCCRFQPDIGCFQEPDDHAASRTVTCTWKDDRARGRSVHRRRNQEPSQLQCVCGSGRWQQAQTSRAS